MAEYRFIGDPRNRKCGPDEIEFRGHVFTRFGWTKIEDDELIAKLDGNSHFEKREPAASHVESEDVTKEALIERAKELGIDFDGRWGIARLQSEIDAATAAMNGS